MSGQALPPWAEDPVPTIAQVAATRPVIVLDDDPTGTQTVRDVPVLTRWTTERLEAWLRRGEPVTYLLTNSRSLPEDRAVELARSIGTSLAAASAAAGVPISVVSRSDSTLRGHFPAEVDALAEGLGMPDARILLAPFFGDGGRVTIGGTHYLRRDGRDIPVAKTEFARDAVFGYRSSDLRAWVVERAGNARGEPALVDLDAIRRGGPGAVRDALLTLPPRGVLIVDAVDERDIETAALGVIEAELTGVPVIARSAGSFARARAGQRPARPLAPDEVQPGVPGLVVVGSHVPTTTRQLETLLAAPPTPLVALELDVEELLARDGDGHGHGSEVARRLGRLADDALAGGRTPVLHTSRTLARGTDAASDLDIGARVSAALVEAVRSIGRRPAWVLAKGGITSSDIATAALDVDEALVVGPLLPGVPTWRCGPGSRWPGLTYLVFPGNVGGPDSLREAVARLSGAA